MSKEETLRAQHRVILRKVLREDFDAADDLETKNFGERERKCENCKQFLMGQCEGQGLKTKKEVEICMLASAIRKRLFSM